MDDKKKTWKRIGLFLSIVGIVAASYGGYYYLYGSHHIETDNAYVTGDQKQVTAQVPGSITEVALKNTQEVTKGQLVAEIEDTDYILQLEDAKANLGMVVRNLSSIETKTILSREALSSAQSDYETSAKDYKREKELYQAGLISRQKMEDAENRYINARNNLSQSKREYENSRLQSKTTDIINHPNVEEAIVQLKKAYLNLARTKIYAPSNGKIAKKSMYIGEMVAAGQPLFAVVDLEKAWVEANFKETQLENLEVGSYVEMKSDLNKKTYEGVVVGISGGSGNAFSLLPPQNATGNWIKITQRVPVRIAFTKESIDKNGALPLGTTMEVNVDTDRKVDAALIEAMKEVYNPYALDEKSIDKEIKRIVEENSLS